MPSRSSSVRSSSKSNEIEKEEKNPIKRFLEFESGKERKKKKKKEEKSPTGFIERGKNDAPSYVIQSSSDHHLLDGYNLLARIWKKERKESSFGIASYDLYIHHCPEYKKKG